MEDIAADDDLLSDMLLDSLEFDPKIATHKMNQAYRSPRYKTQDVIDIVRNRVVVESDVNAALEDLLKLDVIKKHLATKTLRQTQEFQLHSRRYLETYLPDSGVEFALTTRYKRAMDQSNEAQTSKAGLAEAKARAEEQARQEANKQQQQSQSNKGKSRILGENGIALGTTKADLCVVATKPFKAGDLVLLCKGGVKDLTKSEDEALREEAAVDRERQRDQEYNGVLGQGRDFSVIRSARRGCSQLLLGPARFVNHDCDPNCEFHRLGNSQMVFKCLRNIGLNEEITTYYGDNYFEWENSECMCRTCEERGRGFFSASKEPKELIKKENDLGVKAEILKQRRTSQRKVVNPSPPPGKTILEPTTTTIEKNGKVTTKTFHHHVSQRELDQDSTTHRGPKCICLTCGTSFWAPEAWWVPDECRRCERHYRIFKADWPGRLPTEGGWSARAKKKRHEWEIKDIEAKKRKLLHAPSPGISGGSNSETDTPVKLSPLRSIEGDEEPVKAQKARKRRKILQVNADEGTDEDAIDAALRRESPAVTMGSRSAVDRNEEESDLTSVSGEGDAEDFVLPLMMGRSTPSSSSSDRSSSTSSKPSGPKMLGKEAKTETLALYWGAPSGDRRKSRQSQTGLESLSKTVARNTSNRKEHRRNISDMSTASAPPKTGVQYRNINGIQEISLQRRESLPDLEVAVSAVHKDDVSIAQSPFVPVSELAVEASPQLSATSDTSSVRGLPELATKGAARTSVKNLAMAWSAGVDEGGRGSRRRQVRDLSQSIASLPTPTVKRKSTSKDDSREPEEDKELTTEDAHLPSAMQEVAYNSPPLVSEAKEILVERNASPANSIIDSPSRTASPSSGPSPSIAFANRPGVIPGKPIRKNLRWGSGKVSTSRPFVGSIASFAGAPSTATTSTSTFGFGLNSSPSYTPKLSSPTAYPRTTYGAAVNEYEENAAERETPSPMTTKERTSSPLVRAALHASIASGTQLQNATSNGYNSYSSNGNDIKQRPASPPISLMGPPRMTQQEAVSPTTHMSHSMMIPKLEGDPVPSHST